MVTGIGTVNQPQSAGVITSTSTIGNQSVIQGTPAGTVESSMPPRRSNDNRRSNKPIMEKRRRARINNCLNELKTLILDAMKKDPARHSKLEKADILEMTVKHLENLQRQQVAMTAAADPSVINKFRAGFSECASEVGRFPGLEPTVKRRLLQHLANCLQVGVGTIQTTNNNNNNNTTNNNNNIIINKQQQSMETTTPILATQAVTTQQQPTTIAPSVITTAQTTTTQSVQLHILPTQNDQFIHHNGIFFTNGNGTGVQLLPTRLPNGDIALVLPTSIQTTTAAAPTMQQQQQQHHQTVPQKQQQPTQNQQQQQIIYQRTTLSPSQQSQNCHSNSTSPLPMLIPIPTRTSSASSVASSSSGVSSMPPQTNSIPSPQSSSSSSPNHYTSPNSPQHYQQHRYEPMDTTPTSPHHHQSGVIHRYSPPMSKPLSLVIRKTSQPEEEKPWRPW